MTPSQQFIVDVLKQMVALAGILAPCMYIAVRLFDRWMERKLEPRLYEIEENGKSTMRKAKRTQEMMEDIVRAGTPSPIPPGTVFHEYTDLSEADDKRRFERTNPKILLPGLRRK